MFNKFFSAALGILIMIGLNIIDDAEKIQSRNILENDYCYQKCNDSTEKSDDEYSENSKKKYCGRYGCTQ